MFSNQTVMDDQEKIEIDEDETKNQKKMENQEEMKKEEKVLGFTMTKLLIGCIVLSAVLLICGSVILSYFCESHNKSIIKNGRTSVLKQKSLDIDCKEKCKNGSTERLEFMKAPTNGDEGVFPKLIRIPRGTQEENSSILPSSSIVPQNKTSPCEIPVEGLKTAEILCSEFPIYKVCKSYCVYGSTYKEGIMRLNYCSPKENLWSKPFEECKPFVDCSIHQITAGNLTCIENTVLESPVCEIYCEIYEDKSEIEKRNYTCKSDGTWDPPLPFCVELKGVPLVNAPDVTEHVSISCPKYEMLNDPGLPEDGSIQYFKSSM